MVNPRFFDLARRLGDKSLKEVEAEIKKREEEKRKEEEEKKANVLVSENNLEVQRKDNVLTLESKVDFSKNISNEVVLEAEGQKVKYLGYADGLYFEGRSIRGNARLRRYDLKEKVKKVKKRISWFPPRTKIEEKCSKVWICRWEIESDNKFKYFLSDGKTKTDEGSYTYRGALKGDAANQGIKISHELFETVFGPIDKQIMEMYFKFYNK